MKYLKRQKFTNLTKFSINKQLNEAYIYLLYSNNILSNYTSLNYFTLSQYYNTPLKTFTNIILPELDDNLNISNSKTNLLVLPNTNSTLYLNIITYNVQGFNILIKRQLWEEYCLKENFNIVSITETKLNSLRSQKFLNSKHFTYFWASLRNSAEETVLIINNKLKPYIHNVITHSEGAIAIDLFFKHNFKFRIISVYLLTSNKSY